jgi:hypothetical protein
VLGNRAADQYQLATDTHLTTKKCATCDVTKFRMSSIIAVASSQGDEVYPVIRGSTCVRIVGSRANQSVFVVLL